jgi:hypothetical protein
MSFLADVVWCEVRWRGMAWCVVWSMVWCGLWCGVVCGVVCGVWCVMALYVVCGVVTPSHIIPIPAPRRVLK